MFKDYELLHLILDDGEEISIKGKDTIETYCKNNSYPHQHWCEHGVYDVPNQLSHYTKNFILITKDLSKFRSSLEDMGMYTDVRSTLQKKRNIIKVRFDVVDGTFDEFFVKEHANRRLGEPNRYQSAHYNKDGNFILTICKQD